MSNISAAYKTQIMANQQRPVTIYAVLDLDCWYNREADGAGQSYDDHDYENNIMFALNHKLHHKIEKIMEKNNKKKRKSKVVNVTIVGAVDKTGAVYLSVLLERVLCLLNAISEPNSNKKTVVRFKDFVLLDKNKHGKALRPRAGHLLASDSPPSDVSGHVVFLTSRPYIRALLKDRRSWWGDTAGRLTFVSKLIR
uniref:Wsv270-ike protein n=1 Tax=Hemigrapsus takanoi nimavirus TaxID=2133792 RepID=A0A401IP07_9VIRU|nr:MAG: wsv270-ike protein [Hemigrapsus takanoi nimavirus]GBG35346.1 wsv270-ike protein [Hemigrapsus takanoi nimavirus]